jgi:hypothetical protein
MSSPRKSGEVVLMIERIKQKGGRMKGNPFVLPPLEFPGMF